MAAGRARVSASREQLSITDFKSAGVDDHADNSAAMRHALAAVKTHGDVEIPAQATPYLLDGEHYITRPVALHGTGGWLKLRNESAIFHDVRNPWGRYLFHVRSSGVHFVNVRIDGNSIGNSYRSGGVTHYQTVAPAVRSVGLVLVGFYNKTAPGDLREVVFDGCSFVDAPAGGVESFMQGNSAKTPASNKWIHGLMISNSYFEKCQGVQIALADCIGPRVVGNTQRDPYFAHFQWYYHNRHGLYGGNRIDFDSSRIALDAVDPLNKTGGRLNYGGYAKLGRVESAPNLDCHYRGNTLRGAHVYLTSGMEHSSIDDNDIYESEQVGIECFPNPVGNAGNSITRNRIYESDQPGLYLEAVPSPVLVADNYLHGCCTKKRSATYGGRELDCQIMVWGANYVFERNVARKHGSRVKYGVLFHSPKDIARLGAGNDFSGSGNVLDVAVNVSGAYPASGVKAIDPARL